MTSLLDAWRAVREVLPWPEYLAHWQKSLGAGEFVQGAAQADHDADLLARREDQIKVLARALKWFACSDVQCEFEECVAARTMIEAVEKEYVE